MQKLYCIIGRSPQSCPGAQQKVRLAWHVDVDLGHVRKVSRQHCLIIFNFDRETFEIKCLSRKYPVYVNRVPITFSEPAVPIQSGTLIGVGPESFFFLLPAAGVTDSAAGAE